MKVIVGVSDARVSAQPEDALLTFSLGSCIGVALYDIRAGIGGLLHFQLPSSATSDPQRAREHPLMYADTGLKWLVDEMIRNGADRRRLKVRMAGGAKMFNDEGLFDIGRRNHAAVRKIMWQNGMFIDAEDVGGTFPRNMQLNIADGTLLIKRNEQTIHL